jgi:hypothetical protein
MAYLYLGSFKAAQTKKKMNIGFEQMNTDPNFAKEAS